MKQTPIWIFIIILFSGFIIGLLIGRGTGHSNISSVSNDMQRVKDSAVVIRDRLNNATERIKQDSIIVAEAHMQMKYNDSVSNALISRAQSTINKLKKQNESLSYIYSLHGDSLYREYANFK